MLSYIRKTCQWKNQNLRKFFPLCSQAPLARYWRRKKAGEASVNLAGLQMDVRQGAVVLKPYVYSFAPCCKRISTISAWPSSFATDRSVFPLLSVTLTLAPLLSSNRADPSLLL